MLFSASSAYPCSICSSCLISKSPCPCVSVRPSESVPDSDRLAPSIFGLLSRTQDIVTKINILLQEIRDIKKQKLKKNIFNDYKNHPKDIDEGSGQDDIHLIYNSASPHPPLDKLNTPGHHALNPTRAPDTDHNAFAQQKPTPYELWSASPPEWPSSSSSDEDSTDDNAGRVEYGLMKTALPRKRVGMGEGESETEGEREIRGGMEEGLPGPASDAVTKTLGPESDPELERR